MFQKGMSKVPGSGRKKGSANKRKLKKVSEVLAENDLDPVMRIVNILEAGELSPRDEANLWLDLLSYCQAKPRDMGDDDGDFDPDEFEAVGTDDLLKLVKAKTDAS